MPNPTQCHNCSGSGTVPVDHRDTRKGDRRCPNCNGAGKIPHNSASPHLTAQQLADRMHVSVHTVYDWQYKGLAPGSIKIRRHRVYPIAAVEEWERQHTCPAGTA